MENSRADFEGCLELVQGGNTEELRRILDQYPSAADLHDSNGVSLLMHSLYRGRRELAELIAARKTALDIFEAASLGRLDLLKDRVHDRSAVNCHSKDGFTALHFACFFGQPEAARLLIENGAEVNAVADNAMQVMPLHSAASARNLEAARLLLEHGALVNARQQGGWLPIHAAAHNGDRPLVEVLLNHQADPKLPNDQGKTAAMMAREKGHEQIAQLLEECADR